MKWSEGGDGKVGKGLMASRNDQHCGSYEDRLSSVSTTEIKTSLDTKEWKCKWAEYKSRHPNKSIKYLSSTYSICSTVLGAKGNVEEAYSCR